MPPFRVLWFASHSADNQSVGCKKRQPKRRIGRGIAPKVPLTTPQKRRCWLLLSEKTLRNQCQINTFKASNAVAIMCKAGIKFRKCGTRVSFVPRGRTTPANLPEFAPVLELAPLPFWRSRYICDVFDRFWSNSHSFLSTTSCRCFISLLDYICSFDFPNFLCHPLFKWCLSDAWYIMYLLMCP